MKLVRIAVEYTVTSYRNIVVEDGEEKEQIDIELDCLEHDTNMDLSNLGLEVWYESDYTATNYHHEVIDDNYDVFERSA